MYRQKSILCLAMMSTVLATASQEARANDVTIEIKESAVNAMLAELGEFTGETPKITVWLDLWFAKIKLTEGRVFWTLHNLGIDFSSSGIVVTGNVNAQYDGHTMSGAIASANASVQYDAGKHAVRISVSQVTIPFQLDTFFGSYTYNATVNPGVAAEYPLGVAKITHPNQEGGLSVVSLAAATMTPTVQEGKLILQGQVTSW